MEDFSILKPELWNLWSSPDDQQSLWKSLEVSVSLRESPQVSLNLPKSHSVSYTVLKQLSSLLRSVGSVLG